MPVELGQVWQLGKHRLMCGDATSREDMEKLMDGEKATLCFTDPPYGMKKERDGVLNDNLNQNKLLNFNKEWIPLSLDALTDIGSWYCWGLDEALMDIYAAIIRDDKNLALRNLLTWDKGSGQGQNSSELRSYATADEKCLFVMKGKQSSWNYCHNSDNYWEGWEPLRGYLDGECQKMGWDSKDIKRITGVGMYCHWFTKSQWGLPSRKRYAMLREAACGQAFEREYDELKSEYDELKRQYNREFDELIREYNENGRAYFNNTHDNMNNVWHFNRAKAEERFHPTTKPIDLCSRAIKSSSREGDIVLDPFAGGGSTLIACERLNRTCFTMELSPEWCQVVIDRWEDETGETAVLL